MKKNTIHEHQPSNCQKNCESILKLVCITSEHFLSVNEHFRSVLFFLNHCFSVLLHSGINSESNSFSCACSPGVSTPGILSNKTKPCMEKIVLLAISFSLFLSAKSQEFTSKEKAEALAKNEFSKSKHIK